MKNSISLIISLTGSAILIFLGWTDFFGYKEGLMTAGIGSSITSAFIIISFVVENWGRLLIAVHCKWLAIRSLDIRFSMSYLYLIEVDGRFLLVKSSNFNHQYQLVGGKYKVYDIGKAKLAELGARTDENMSVSGLAQDDLALFLPAKNALKFLDWFNSGKNREVSHWREFYEELIGCDEGILSSDIFTHVDYYFEKSVLTPIKTTPGWSCREILQFDVLRLIPSERQLQELRVLMRNGDTDYVKWASRQQIASLGQNSQTLDFDYKIGEHTKWALNGRYSAQ
jgi:hypothetical protein